MFIYVKPNLSLPCWAKYSGWKISSNHFLKVHRKLVAWDGREKKVLRMQAGRDLHVRLVVVVLSVKRKIVSCPGIQENKIISFNLYEKTGHDIYIYLYYFSQMFNILVRVKINSLVELLAQRVSGKMLSNCNIAKLVYDFGVESLVCWPVAGQKIQYVGMI